ncbi:hypothetical protein [Streptomyces sp. NPDC008139]|uniref:hypothetical protein n=1 Tax=Streptomyces sp. NPDC008139 TaxID=3364814 RepID=UPI0036EFE945
MIDGLIAAADDGDRPGLEKAAAAIRGFVAAAGDPQVKWARQALANSGIEATNQIDAVRELRSQAAGLGVLDAGILLKKVIENDREIMK